MYSQQVWFHSYSWTINSKQLLSTQPRRSTKSSQGDKRCLAPLCRVLTQLIGLSATRFSDLCLSFIIYYCSHTPLLSPPPSRYGMWFSVSPAVCVWRKWGIRSFRVYQNRNSNEQCRRQLMVEHLQTKMLSSHNESTSHGVRCFSVWTPRLRWADLCDSAACCLAC